MIIPVKVDAAAQKAASAVEDAAKGRGEKVIKEGGLSVPQWSMVELQGELLSKDALSGQSLGKMTFENGKPALVISNHKLEGKAASEPKPLLVLRKVILPDSDPDEKADGGGTDVAGGGGDGKTRAARQRVEYRVIGRVTRKSIFKTRPKPLIRKLGGGDG